MIVFHLDDGKEFRGGQRQVLYLVKELNKLNLKNFIVCRRNSPLEKESLKRNLKTFTLPYFFEWDLFSALTLKRRVLEVLNKFQLKYTPHLNPHIVSYGHTTRKQSPPPQGERINSNFDTRTYPVILHSHTSHAAAISHLTSLFLPCIRIVHRRVDFKIKRGLSFKAKYLKADGIIAISNAIKRIMTSARIPERMISVIRSSIDLDEIPSGITNESYKKESKEKISRIFNIPKDSFWIGSLIALVPHKDPENLLRSAKLVLEKHPQVQFIIAGDGILKDRMHRLVRELNLAKNFHLLGYYNNPQELLSSLDMFVLPSVEEGMGSVLLEAMCAGLPIIATDAGGIPEVIENEINGLIVRKKNPQELAKAQVSLIENEELRKKFAENGAKKIPEFSSEKMAELTLKVYEKTIENFKHS